MRFSSVRAAVPIVVDGQWPFISLMDQSGLVCPRITRRGNQVNQWLTVQKPSWRRDMYTHLERRDLTRKHMGSVLRQPPPHLLLYLPTFVRELMPRRQRLTRRSFAVNPVPWVVHPFAVLMTELRATSNVSVARDTAYKLKISNRDGRACQRLPSVASATEVRASNASRSITGRCHVVLRVQGLMKH